MNSKVNTTVKSLYVCKAYTPAFCFSKTIGEVEHAIILTKFPLECCLCVCREN